MYLRYLDKYAKPFSSKHELSKIVQSVPKGRRWFILALRHFFKFLEERDYVDDVELFRLRKAIPVPKTGADPEYPPTQEIVRGYQILKREELRLLYCVLLYSGIRVVEGVHMLKNFDPSSLIRINGKAYRYPINWERGTKRVFFAYLPGFFVPSLRKADLPNYETVKKLLWLKDRGVNITSKKLRKWSDNFLVECGVPERIADFIQGRARVTVGSKHYLEMIHHADRWYTQIVDKFPRLE